MTNPTPQSDARRYVEAMPRRTLAERAAYWEARHQLEDEPRANLVRAYVISAAVESVSAEVAERGIDAVFGEHRSVLVGRVEVPRAAIEPEAPWDG